MKKLLSQRGRRSLLSAADLDQHPASFVQLVLTLQLRKYFQFFLLPSPLFSSVGELRLESAWCPCKALYEWPYAYMHKYMHTYMPVCMCVYIYPIHSSLHVRPIIHEYAFHYAYIHESTYVYVCILVEMHCFLSYEGK